MAIQWFPGHMHKARKDIVQVMPDVDLVIEVLDARIPFSSENPMIGELRSEKPCIKILNKSDLADPALSSIWQEYLEQDRNVRTLQTRTDEPETIRRLTNLCRKMVSDRTDEFRPIHTMIMGIPNVGKSSIINILAGRSIAKTGNEPAITKARQKIRLENGITLSDTPGVLWPNVENPNSGYRLALTGAIKDTAIDHTDVAFFALDYFIRHYPEIIKTRFQLDDTPSTELEAMEAIGRKRGCLGSGGMIDLDRVAKILLTEYRSGNLGQLTLETPEIMLDELSEVEKVREDKAAKKQQRLEKRQKKKR